MAEWDAWYLCELGNGGGAAKDMDSGRCRFGCFCDFENNFDSICRNLDCLFASGVNVMLVYGRAERPDDGDKGRMLLGGRLLGETGCGERL